VLLIGGGWMAKRKKLKSLNKLVWEKVCLVDAFVYGTPVKSPFQAFLMSVSEFFEGFMLNSGGAHVDC